MLTGKFARKKLTNEEIENLKETARQVRGDILRMTTLAGCGHPGGSMSSADIYVTVWSHANINPENQADPARDRVVVSHGHTSPGVYAVLGRHGFFDMKQAVATFRLAGSPFEGHIERSVPGVEWSTGNLGQGLSAGCGFALSSRLRGITGNHVFVLMSDGEQTKGQVAESRRFAKKFGLNNLTVIIDYNKIQISGTTDEVMPQRLRDIYEADGWRVLEVDGHDMGALFEAIVEAQSDEGTPVAILARTTIGKGVSFMEGTPAYHGKALSEEEFEKAMGELDLPADLSEYRALREKAKFEPVSFPEVAWPEVEKGAPRTYAPDVKTDNRSAYGAALADIAKINDEKEVPFAVFDCDLASSVKTDGFGKVRPEQFFESGVQEHSTATTAGAVSADGVITFFSDFGVFGVDETYNQHRLNDINHTNLKLVCTHNGLDVGEDGKTHQCIDYLGLLRNLFTFKVIIPADPNQTDRVIRFIASQPGNFFVGMGRSKTPVVTTKDGAPYFGPDYVYEYGRIDRLRDGEQGAIYTYGAMVPHALKAWEVLMDKGISVKVFNVSCPLNLDMEKVAEGAGTGLVVSYEDHNRNTGLGATLALALCSIDRPVRMMRVGVHAYGESGKPDVIMARMGMAPEDLVRVVESALAANATKIEEAEKE
ncbi:MAG: transketolase [Deltaproteobacteria bacterium]|nr:MAG: transketolase [Deltaproteobacteria bacterium]